MQACELSARAAGLLSQAGEEAVSIVAEAVERAKKTLHDAERTSEKLKADAYANGISEAAARWAEEMTQKAFDAQRSIHKASERLAELVSMATQRVIEVEDKDGLYRRALRTVRHLAQDSKTLVLHIGANDAEYANTVVADIATEMGIDVPLEIKVDNSLSAGGCVLESDYGVIDASLGLQIHAVKEAIAKAARSALSRIEQHPTTEEEVTGDAT
jgi:type III secretion protein L